MKTGEWPRDQAEYVFLDRAVDLWGARKFGSNWTGREKERKPMLPLPSFSESSTHENRPARRDAHLILSSDPAYIACPFVPTTYQTPPFGFRLMPRGGLDYDFSEAMWQRAKMIRDAQIEKAKPGWQRLGEIRRDLLDAFVMGAIRTGVRDKTGAAVALLPPEIWSVVNALNVFDWCQMDPDHPTTIASSGTAFKWIFVARSDLVSLLEQQAEHNACQPDSADRIEVVARRALRNMMETFPDTPCPKDLVFQRLSVTHTKLSQREFLRLWSDVAQEVAPSWSKRGRRPQQSADEIDKIIAALNRRT